MPEICATARNSDLKIVPSRMKANLRTVSFILLSAALLCGGHLRAQVPYNARLFQNSSATDADTLSKVVVSGSAKHLETNSKFSPGLHVQSLELPQISSLNSLGDVLQKETSLYIKEYGRGMNSYISVRGTSSSHTSVDWNGESFSMPTMGQADLSHIPLYFFDNLSLHLGGGSALYGNGSIGGSIQLASSPVFANHADGEFLFSGDITVKGGSYESFFTGVTAKYASCRNSGRTSAYWNFSNNAFSFKNNSKPGEPSERQHNSQFANWGVYQQVAHKFKDEASVLSFNFIHLNFNRQVQPSVASNSSPALWHDILDRNTKAILSFTHQAGLKYNASLSFNRDYELYENDVIAANRFAASAGLEYSVTGWNFKAGGRAEYIKPEVEWYDSGTYEWRSEIYALVFWKPVQSLMFGGGLRGTFVTNTSVPVQPVLNMKWMATHWLAFRASASRSTKVPTMNDKYWGGVNAYLKPEKGTTFEGGVDLGFIVGAWNLNAFATVFNTDVKDWIRWLPAGEVWRPKNVPKVRTKGVESGVKATGTYGNTVLKFSANYSYTDVRKLESDIPLDPSVGKQMAYQPYNVVNCSAGIDYRKWNMILGYNYTGSRTTTDIYDSLPGYSLLDLSLAREFKLFDYECTLCGELKNILNTSYQNVKFYAMPGMNFMISAQVRF